MQMLNLLLGDGSKACFYAMPSSTFTAHRCDVNWMRPVQQYKVIMMNVLNNIHGNSCTDIVIACSLNVVSWEGRRKVN
jgi:hypothetical protein